MSESSIPVICDRCGAAGLAGQADFSHLGDLLEFDPVPRQLKRQDGWTPEAASAAEAAEWRDKQSVRPEPVEGRASKRERKKK